MSFVTALVVGVLFGAGVYLMVRRDMIELALGSLLVGNAGVLLLVAAGFRAVPTRAAGDPDPLAQALALTAVVIGFGTTVLLLRVMLAVAREHASIDLEEIVAAEREEAQARDGSEDAP